MNHRPKLKTPEQLADICADWNAAHPIGAEVKYHPVIGFPAHRVRKTRSQAQVLSGHTAVVWLDGEAGCVALEACEPAGSGPVTNP